MADNVPIAGATDDHWRIDELARRSGATVDTIRFYQRDGLLPPAQRAGRSTVYGPAHLHRIEQIRDLQARHFNLAAVKALLTDSRMEIIQAMFTAERTLTHGELVAKAGIDDGLLQRIKDCGLLPEPSESGRTGYDRLDVDVLVTVKEMLTMGIPEDIVLFMARMYSETFAAMQQRVIALWAGSGEIDWPEEERAALMDRLGSRVPELIQLTTRLLNYAHQATVRRMTVTMWVGDSAPDSVPIGAAGDEPAADAGSGTPF